MPQTFIPPSPFPIRQRSRTPSFKKISKTISFEKTKCNICNINAPLIKCQKCTYNGCSDCISMVSINNMCPSCGEFNAFSISNSVSKFSKSLKTKFPECKKNCIKFHTIKL